MSDLQTIEAPAAIEPPDAALPQAEPTTAQPDATQGEKTPQVERTYTREEMQERIEAATAKAAAKAERRAYREALSLRGAPAPAQQPAPQAHEVAPVRQDGESDAAFISRSVKWELDKRDHATNQQRAQAQNDAVTAKTERMYAEASKVPGFDREEFDHLMQTQPFTREFTLALIDSDQSAQLMAYVSSHPEEAQRIAALSPARQAAELGKLEDRLQKAPKVSNASPPIKPIGSRGAGLTKPLEQMSASEMEASMKARGSKWVR